MGAGVDSAQLREAAATTALLKDAILLAAENADEQGLVGYLKKQAIASPVAFMALLGKVLPLQLTGQGSGPLGSPLAATRGCHPPPPPPANGL